MNLCDNRHDEVCYTCRKCPVCEQLDNIEVLEAQITKLEDTISELEYVNSKDE